MGLNESFAQIRGQILLTDPIPPINKVFSLISQEEKHRAISSGRTSNTSNSINSLVFTVRNDITKRSGAHNSHSGNSKGQKRERPLCTHCNMLGHTIDKCYKLHGYPPGYKPRQKTQNISIKISSKEDKDKDSGSGSTPQSLNPDQYQQLLFMLSTHLAFVKPPNITEESSISYLTGTCHSSFVNTFLIQKTLGYLTQVHHNVPAQMQICLSVLNLSYIPQLVCLIVPT